MIKSPENFPFPFPPYDIQIDLMKQIFEALEKRNMAILESPTGTGKSLSLICGALKWLEEHNKKEKTNLLTELQRETEAVESCQSTEDWFSAASQRKDHVDKIQTIKSQISCLTKEEERIKQIKIRRKRAKEIGHYRNYKNGNEEKENISEGLSKNSENFEEDEFLLSDNAFDDFTEDAVDEDQEDTSFKIFYCSRTHSQLSQFVSEIHKTVYGKENTRVVSLAARPNLCVNSEVLDLKFPGLINDRCLEMQKNSSSKSSSDASKKTKISDGAKKCAFKSSALGIRQLADEVLSDVLDLEDVMKLGRQTKSCPYYSARMALRDAQLVVVPYQNIIQENTRKACGINLKDNVLIVDEAHNLLSTLASSQEAVLSYTQACQSKALIQEYLDKYEKRLSARNILSLQQIIYCLKAIIFAMGVQTQKVPRPNAVASDKLVSVPSFLLACRIDNINMINIVQYIKNSNLVHKLHGFNKHKLGSVEVNLPEKKNDTSSFLSKLSCGSQKMTSPISSEVKAPSHSSALITSNPLLPVLELLQRFTSLNASGRLLLHRDTVSANCYLKYLVLDASKHFHDIVRECRSVILLGGTMKPMSEFRESLFLSAGIPSDRIQEFSCGHVVSEKNLLPIVLKRGPTKQEFYLTHSNRSDKNVIVEVGRVLCNISSVVPNGVVVFLPSYKYMSTFIEVLKKEGLFDKINAKKQIIEEPRESQQLSEVLCKYSSIIRREKSKGAILFCVVGGKMSEGINFSDELGRCVVMIGMPYPNTQCPELNGRIDHLNKKSSNSGSEMYHNLCFRAVNQSIGRSIRHRNDYACILLLDQRYAVDKNVASLPHWIGDKLSVCETFGSAQATIAKFFKSHSS